ncbi:MAG TPA: nuclear transport factor 2 family protein [Micropepsaceae bacterium]|nr:nuclear transport factor 2 family protein [Micropepsaceae bacterium]
MRSSVFGFFALLLLAVPAHANVPPPEPEETVREAVLAYLENFNAGSADGLAAMFADHPYVHVLENGRLVTAGRMGVREVIGGTLETTPGMRMEVVGDINVLMAPSGDAAVADYTFTFHVRGDDGNEVQLFQGVTSLTVFQGLQGWEIAAIHTSALTP